MIYNFIVDIPISSLYIYNMEARRLYNRIAVLRKERGLSRKQLAEAVGVNFQTVGYLEREEYNPSLDLAFRISAYFGLPVDMVFSTEPMRPLSEEILRWRRKDGAGYDKRTD
jgi:putative transcriptional regulator